MKYRIPIIWDDSYGVRYLNSKSIDEIQRRFEEGESVNSLSWYFNLSPNNVQSILDARTETHEISSNSL